MVDQRRRHALERHPRIRPGKTGPAGLQRFPAIHRRSPLLAQRGLRSGKPRGLGRRRRFLARSRPVGSIHEGSLGHPSTRRSDFNHVDGGSPVAQRAGGASGRSRRSGTAGVRRVHRHRTAGAGARTLRRHRGQTPPPVGGAGSIGFQRGVDRPKDPGPERTKALFVSHRGRRPLAGGVGLPSVGLRRRVPPAVVSMVRGGPGVCVGPPDPPSGILGGNLFADPSGGAVFGGLSGRPGPGLQRAAPRPLERRGVGPRPGSVDVGGGRRPDAALRFLPPGLPPPSASGRFRPSGPSRRRPGLRVGRRLAGRARRAPAGGGVGVRFGSPGPGSGRFVVPISPRGPAPSDRIHRGRGLGFGRNRKRPPGRVGGPGRPAGARNSSAPRFLLDVEAPRRGPARFAGTPPGSRRSEASIATPSLFWPGLGMVRAF